MSEPVVALCENVEANDGLARHSSCKDRPTQCEQERRMLSRSG